MLAELNPWDAPEWHALKREAALVRHLLGSGVTSLGRANYADNMGEYYTALFGLSVGLEGQTSRQVRFVPEADAVEIKRRALLRGALGAETQH
jgi:hypothetical protein